MSLEARGLYMHLNVVADDDGFISSPIATSAMVGAKKEHLQELIDNGYLLSFDSGICLITDWHINNTLKNDRYTETLHIEERKKVYLEHKKYYLCTSDKPTDYGSKMEPQKRKDKNSIAKNNIVKKNSFCDFPQREYPPDFYDKLEQAAAQRI